MKNSMFRRALTVLVVVGLVILTGCTGVPLRDVGVLAGAAVGAEGNPGRPVLGAVRGAVIGGVIGAVADAHRFHFIVDATDRCKRRIECD